MALHISEELANIIQNEAKSQGKSIEDFLKSVVRRERTLADRQKIEAEQEWWENLSPAERRKYQGKFIAVHHKKIVDHDKDESALYARVREKFGNLPVLIMPAEGPREVHILSPRVAQQ